MHISDVSLGMLGANGIVGAGPPIAIGAAFSNRYRGTRNVTCCFFGDGASNEGSFHEAANMAALYRLPVVFVCENNGFGEFTRQERHQAIHDIADRASGYGMPGAVIDGMDVLAVYEGAEEAVARARRGEGPSLLECKTYRFYDHVGVRGMGLAYRTDEEVVPWRERDPLPLFEGRLLAAGTASQGDFDQARERILFEIREAIAFAEASPYPQPSALMEDVYTEGVANAGGAS
jgi:pyruvate dehydrogenase E1 component alpha subunit